MRYLEIAGGAPLHGSISIQGSKNGVLPVLAACMLGEGLCVIENCPAIGDVRDTLEIMRRLGCRISREGSTVCIDPSEAEGCLVDEETAVRIRSSILFLGALLGKMGKAMLPQPGGCAIGKRPVDLHLEALASLGVEFQWENQYIVATGEKLHGGRVRLRLPSVGATENVILASVTAKGQTVIENAAREPEIDELCEFLRLRGARIERRQEGSLVITGVDRLLPAVYRMRADRIVTGTYLLAAAATGGRIRIQNFPRGELDALLEVLKAMGARLYFRDIPRTDREIWGKNNWKFREENDRREPGCYNEAEWKAEEQSAAAKSGLEWKTGKQSAAEETGFAEEKSCELVLQGPDRPRAVSYVETSPYPGFPTDLQSPLMAALCRARGESCICETIFEGRFRTAGELNRLGASIQVAGQCAVIQGREKLEGAELVTPDLRGGAALVIGALQAEGRSRITNISYVERGYEDISRDMRLLGARIWLKDQ